MQCFFFLVSFLSVTLAYQLVARAPACNNSPDLCNLSYGDITHLGAHDSPFVYSLPSSLDLASNQYFDTPTQLNAGVRLISAQIHQSNSQWRLCHSDCNIMDAGLLRNWLGDIKTWLDQNENDVITILLVNVNNATASELDSEFRASNITSYAYEPESLDSAPPSWPTLQSMIDAGKRLVVFVPGLSTRESFPYLMDEWDFVWENPYDVRSPSEFSCNAERPSTDISTLAASKRLPLMNHFLYSNDISELGIEYPNSSYITTTNAASGGTGNLGITAANCKTRWGRSPAFILVDFFNHGPAIETVDS